MTTCRNFRTPGAILLVALVLQSTARADLFEFLVQTTSGTPQTKTVGGSNLIDLGNDLIKAQNQFAAFENRDITATLKYAGVPDAIRTTVNASGTRAVLDIPSTGLHKVFTGANRDDLQNQVEDFIKKNGSDEWAKFLSSIDGQSLVSVTDGNPQAATAMMANDPFYRFGMHARWTEELRDGNLRSTPDSPFTFEAFGGRVLTSAGDGWYAEGSIGTAIPIGDRLALSFSLPFMYRTIEDADAYNIGGTIGLPILLVAPLLAADSSFAWQITPFGASAGSASPDFVAGGWIAGGGVTNVFALRLNDTTISLATEFAVFGGQPVSYEDFRFEPDVDSQILKNGIRVTHWFSRGLGLYAGTAYTNFLKTAAVDSYFTPEAGIDLRLGERGVLQLGFLGDFAPDGNYRTYGANVALRFSF
jgi:hypothetical protein